MSKQATIGEHEVEIDRRRDERRVEEVSDASAEVASKPIEAAEFNPPRRKKQRRRQIDPTTCERDYNNDEIEFMQALDAYKRSSGRMFPTCSEILEVVREMGYVRLSEEQLEEFVGDAQWEDEGESTEETLDDELEAELDDAVV